MKKLEITFIDRRRYILFVCILCSIIIGISFSLYAHFIKFPLFIIVPVGGTLAHFISWKAAKKKHIVYLFENGIYLPQVDIIDHRELDKEFIYRASLKFSSDHYNLILKTKVKESTFWISAENMGNLYTLQSHLLKTKLAAA